MEDIGTPPYDSKAIELWVHKELKSRNQAALIADELLKSWGKSQLTIQAKYVAGRFCLINGFHASLLRSLRADLISGNRVPWGLVVEILFQKRTGGAAEVDQDLITAILTGATRDNQLHSAAAQALMSGDKDERWPKILSEELKLREGEARKQRDHIFNDLKILKAEGMEPEVREAITKILAIFPEDSEAKTLARDLKDQDVERTIARVRKAHHRKPPVEERVLWPELAGPLERIKGKLDVDQAYHLSIALYQMGLFAEALDILRTQKTHWRSREKIWELELLISRGYFAEALGIAQTLTQEHVADADALRAILYNAAKAYYGLEDTEQAVSILKGLLEHHPNYRDAAVLLVEWSAGAL